MNNYLENNNGYIKGKCTKSLNSSYETKRYDDSRKYSIIYIVSNDFFRHLLLMMLVKNKIIDSSKSLNLEFNALIKRRETILENNQPVEQEINETKKYYPFNIYAYSNKIIIGGETIGIEVHSDGVYISHCRYHLFL